MQIGSNLLKLIRWSLQTLTDSHLLKLIDWRSLKQIDSS